MENKKVDLSLIAPVLDEYADVKGSLITILQNTQEIYGYLPKEAIELICVSNGTATSEIMGVTIKDELGIDDGQTTEDGLFSLKCVACLGCCSLSPVMMINEDTYGSLTPDKTKKILKELREAAV